MYNVVTFTFVVYVLITMGLSCTDTIHWYVTNS